MAGIGATRLKEKPEFKMREKDIEFYQYIANESKESPKIEDFCYTNDRLKAFHAESAGFTVLDNTQKIDDNGNTVAKNFNFRFKIQRRSMPTTKTIMIQGYNASVDQKYGSIAGTAAKMRISFEKATEIWPFFCVPCGPRDYETSVCPSCFNLDCLRSFVQCRRKLKSLSENDLADEAAKINFGENEKFFVNQLIKVPDGVDKHGKEQSKWQERRVTFLAHEFHQILADKLDKISNHKMVVDHEKTNYYPLLNGLLDSGFLSIHSDFAMNAKCFSKNAPQEDFMKPTERQMLCNVVKFKNSEGDISKIYEAHIGDDKRHDNVLVSQSIIDIYTELQAKFNVTLKGVVMKSDNQMAQFKCRYALGNYYMVCMILKIPEFIIVYGTELHGKCECDALGGGLKGVMKRLSIAGSELYTAKEIVKALSTQRSKHVDKWLHAVPADHFDDMLTNYKVQPDGPLYGVDKIKQVHMIHFKYTDAIIKTDKKTKKSYIELPYKTNDYFLGRKNFVNNF